MTERRLPIGLFLAVLMIGAALPSRPALAAEFWQAKTSGSFVTLRYGPADEREKPVFLLSCLNGVGIAVLSVYMDFPENQPGGGISIDFSAGDQTASVAAETAAEDGTGIIYAEAGDIAVSPILKVLKEKGTVVMKSDANAADLSANGRAEAVAEFSKDCSLD